MVCFPPFREKLWLTPVHRLILLRHGEGKDISLFGDLVGFLRASKSFLPPLLLKYG
jgi:hypothetical protein